MEPFFELIIEKRLYFVLIVGIFVVNRIPNFVAKQ